MPLNLTFSPSNGEKGYVFDMASRLPNGKGNLKNGLLSPTCGVAESARRRCRLWQRINPAQSGIKVKGCPVSSASPRLRAYPKTQMDVICMVMPRWHQWGKSHHKDERRHLACLYLYLADQETEKASPLADKEDGTDLPPLGSIMVRGSGVHEPIGASIPPVCTEAASQPEKLTVPKSASGKTLRDEGASTTHSAEARAAEVTVV